MFNGTTIKTGNEVIALLCNADNAGTFETMSGPVRLRAVWTVADVEQLRAILEVEAERQILTDLDHEPTPGQCRNGDRYAACSCGWETDHGYAGDTAWTTSKVDADWSEHANAQTNAAVAQRITDMDAATR